MLSLHSKITGSLLIALSLSISACSKQDKSAKTPVRRGSKVGAPADQSGKTDKGNNGDKSPSESEASNPSMPIILEELDPRAQDKSKSASEKDSLKDKDDTSNPDTREEIPIVDEEEEDSDLKPQLSTSSKARLDNDDSSDSSTTSLSEKEKKADSCTQLKDELADLNWEYNEIETYENTDSLSGKKIKVAYYSQKNSPLKNPVLYLNGYANRKVTSSMLKALNELSESYDFDPIVMDSRGTGCSSALPQASSLQDWQYYSSRSIAEDAELIRQKILKSEKWKVWAHQVAGYTALRLVELAPEGVKSIHITDFTPMTSFTNYMIYRLKSQAKAWRRLTHYLETDRKLKLTSSDIKKIQSFLDKQTCKEDQKICGAALMDTFAYLLGRGRAEDWKKAADLIEDFRNEKTDKSQTLQTIAANIQSGRQFAVAMRMIDMDKDLDQMACTEAMKAAALKEIIDSSPLNTCRIETQLGRDDVAKLKKVLKHDALDMSLIKSNMEKHKIAYHWLVADMSLFNPIEAAQEHYEMFKPILRSNFKSEVRNIEVSTDKLFLETLKEAN